MILLLVDKRTKDARMVLKDQTSRTLAEFHGMFQQPSTCFPRIDLRSVGKIKPSCTENCFELGDQKIELSTRRGMILCTLEDEVVVVLTDILRCI